MTNRDNNTPIYVFFETNNDYSELVAKFSSEEMYIACLPILKKQAWKLGFTRITETLVE